MLFPILGAIMILQPPEDWVQRRSVPTSEIESNEKFDKDILGTDHL